MDHVPEPGEVVFRPTGAGRRPLPLAIPQRTLGVLLAVWAPLEIAKSVASIQVDVLALTPPSRHPPLLGVLQANPFPWTWYWVAAPSLLVIFAVTLLAGAILMTRGVRLGRSAAAASIVLSIGTQGVSLVVELAHLSAPFQFVWQQAVITASSAALLGGILYLVVATQPDRRSPNVDEPRQRHS